MDDELFYLCAPVWFAEALPRQGLAKDYDLLVREVFRLMLKQELFTFVTAPAVEQPNGTVQAVAGTNNEAERTLRGPAQARDTGRTNKISAGSRRQTIITSVLESLRLYVTSFALASLLAELQHWWEDGRSCFEKLADQLKLQLPEEPSIDRIFASPSPQPSG